MLEILRFALFQGSIAETIAARTLLYIKSDVLGLDKAAKYAWL